MTTEHAFLTELRQAELPVGDYVLFGSGPMVARGWIDDPGDLDVVARGAAWAQACERGQLVHIEEYGVDVVNIGTNITVGVQWGIGDVDIDHLIDTAELVHGIPCARLEHVVAYKELRSTPRDHEHLELLRRHAPHLWAD